jgi:hypothetical protein
MVGKAEAVPVKKVRGGPLVPWLYWPAGDSAMANRDKTQFGN